MLSLAVFDFDGTITTKDSMIEFLKFYEGSFKFYWIFILFSPIIIYYILFKKQPSKAKRAIISYYLKGKSKKEILEKGQIFSEHIIPKLILKKAYEKILWHLKNNHRVIIVSASLDIWLEPWAKKNNLELICTNLEFHKDVATGNFATPNCNGKEKVVRICNYVNISKYKTIYAYGNSKGDLPMLSIANHSFMKHFN